MAGVDSEDPYERLGVEPDVDPRALKKAYAALIRKFPPETHPREFQAIREAYELLSDPEARARHDARVRSRDNLDEAEKVALEHAEARLWEGSPAGARELLAEVLERHPAALEARLRLIRLLGDAGQHTLATEHLQRAVELHAQVAQLRVELAFALARQDDHAGARRELEAAVNLEPGELAPRMLLAQAWAAAGAPAEAERVLDQAEPLLRTPGERLEALERRIRLRVPRGAGVASGRRLAEAVDALEALANTAGDDLKRRATTRLQACAASFFLHGQAAAANRVLEACARLRPSDPWAHPILGPTTLARKDLPAPLAAWLAGQVIDGQTVVATPRTTRVGFLGVGLAGCAAAASLLFRRWVGGGEPLLDILLVVAVVASVLVGVRVRTEERARPRPLVALHPLYFVQAREDHVVLWPWALLSEVRANVGSAGPSQVVLVFGDRYVAVALYGRPAVEGFARAIEDAQREGLAHLAGEPSRLRPLEILVPPSRLPPDAPPPPPSRSLSALAVVLATAVLGVMVLAAPRLTPLQEVSLADQAEEWEVYLDDPADEAAEVMGDARWSRLDEEGERGFRELIDEDAPGAAALLAAAAAVGPGGSIPVRSRGVEATFGDELAAAFFSRGQWLRAHVVSEVDADELAFIDVRGEVDAVRVGVWIDGKEAFSAEGPVVVPDTCASVVSRTLGLGLSAARRRAVLGTPANPYGEVP